MFFSSKTWHALQVVESSSSSVEAKKSAVAEAYAGGNELDFLEQMKLAKKLSLASDKERQEARARLKQRAAVFGLEENTSIDTEGDCQFDAVADQMRKYEKFAAETKESVRARAVDWIAEHADYDLGDGVTLKEWVESTVGVAFFKCLNMSKIGCLGDEATILAIVEAFQVSVVLVSPTVGQSNWYRTHYPRGKSEKDALPASLLFAFCAKVFTLQQESR